VVICEIYWRLRCDVSSGEYEQTFRVNIMSSYLWQENNNLHHLSAGTHYPHVTWAHVMLRVQLGCERRFNIEFCGADSHFCHSAYVTWTHVELWSAQAPARLSRFCCRTHFVRRDQRVDCSVLSALRALNTLVTPHEMCATTETWKACWRLSRPELHVRSRDVSRVTKVWICATEFNVKSPLTSQLHA
jgi:hypothetical protein